MLQGAGSRERGPEPAHVGPATQAGLGRAAQSSRAHSRVLTHSPKATAPALNAAICSFYWCNWPGPDTSLILGAFSASSNRG